MVSYKRRLVHYFLISAISLAIGYAISLACLKEDIYAKANAGTNITDMESFHIIGRVLAMFLVSVLLYAHGPNHPQYMDSVFGKIWDFFFLSPISIITLVARGLLICAGPVILTVQLIAYLLYAPFLVVMLVLEILGIVKNGKGINTLPTLVLIGIAFLLLFALGCRWGMVPENIVASVEGITQKFTDYINKILFGFIGYGLEA